MLIAALRRQPLYLKRMASSLTGTANNPAWLEWMTPLMAGSSPTQAALNQAALNQAALNQAALNQAALNQGGVSRHTLSLIHI